MTTKETIVKKLALTDSCELDEYRQIVYAEVYSPMVLDTHGDFMTAETIEEMAHTFLKDGHQTNIDVMHDGAHIEACVVESFIARDGDPDFIAKSWVVGIHISCESSWQAILNGDLNGLSLEALAYTEDVNVIIEVPDTVKGLTSTDNGHRHSFTAKYDKEGNFTGGVTDEVDGHSHTITHETYTSTNEGHSHRFDTIEEFYITNINK